MKAAIFGAGVAGLVTAITLSRSGHSCRVYERVRSSQDAGMGFILVPEGIQSLQALGVNLDDEFGGTTLENYCWRSSEGEMLHQERMPAGARGIRRRDLMAALMSALPDPEAIIFDAELSSLKFDHSGAVIAACITNGEQIAADLYVGADGIHSRARRSLFPGWPSPQARVAEVVGLVHSPEVIRWSGHTFNKFHALEGGLAVGVLPVDGEHLVWYFQFDNRRFSPPQENAEARRSFVQNLIGDWADPIPQLIAQTDFSRVHLWRPIDTDLIPYFNYKNLVLVGDAAHPLLPFTSQGVSSAVEDAITLAQLTTSGQDLNESLSAYSMQRRLECEPFIAKGRELMRCFLQPQGARTMVLPIAESPHHLQRLSSSR
jgi:2-polyprenyl-6-methoxyphenol hydroxylase-like FAD-dependent oxidoreductase